MRTSPQWPTLLRDGAWREQKIKGQYFGSYIRRRWGSLQRITWNATFGVDEKTAWVLESGSRYVSHGSLDKLLYLADLQ